MAKSKKRKLHTVSNHNPNPYSRAQLHKGGVEKRKSGNRPEQDSKGAHGRGGSGKHKGKVQGNGKGARGRELPFDVQGNVLCIGEGRYCIGGPFFRSGVDAVDISYRATLRTSRMSAFEV